MFDVGDLIVTIFTYSLKQLKRGEINWSPEIPDGEDTQPLAKHQEDMQKGAQESRTRYRIY